MSAPNNYNVDFKQVFTICADLDLKYSNRNISSSTAFTCQEIQNRDNCFKDFYSSFRIFVLLKKNDDCAWSIEYL